MQFKRLMIVSATTVACLAAFLHVGSAQAIQFKPRVHTWYLQVVATTEDGLVDDRSGVIGRIPGGSSGKDLHDIPAFASVNGAPIAVISVRGSEWGENAGEYLSDYRAPGVNRQVWDFVVTARDPNARVTLQWDGLHAIEEGPNGGFDTTLANDNKVLRQLRLIDLKRGRVVRLGVKPNGGFNPYTFRMNGDRERHFRWVMGAPKDEDLTLANALRLDAVSPLPLDFDARLDRSGEAQGKVKQDGFGAPPAIGVEPGNGVGNPGFEARLDGSSGAETSASGVTPSGEPLFKPVRQESAESQDR